METLKEIKRDLELLKREVEELKIAVDIEPEVRPEYIRKLRNLEKNGKYSKTFSSVEELDKHIKSNAQIQN